MTCVYTMLAEISTAYIWHNLLQQCEQMMPPPYCSHCLETWILHWQFLFAPYHCIQSMSRVTVIYSNVVYTSD